MAETRRFAVGNQLGIEHLWIEAKHRWLRPAEICEILRNYQKFSIDPEPPNTPPSGSLFLFDRKVVRYFRKDGHNWRKRKDGKTVKEAHEKLKVGGTDMLHCYYAHGEGNEYFQRRSYWMIEEELSHIVLVHYKEVKQNRTNVNHIKVVEGSTPCFQEMEETMDVTSLNSAWASENEEDESDDEQILIAGQRKRPRQAEICEFIRDHQKFCLATESPHNSGSSWVSAWENNVKVLYVRSFGELHKWQTLLKQTSEDDSLHLSVWPKDQKLYSDLVHDLTSRSREQEVSCDDLYSPQPPLAQPNMQNDLHAQLSNAERGHSLNACLKFLRKELSISTSESSEGDSSHASNLPTDHRLYSDSAHNLTSAGHGDEPVHAAAVRIQNKFRSWKARKVFLIIRQLIVKIQAHVRGHQVRKNYKKIGTLSTQSVDVVLENIIDYTGFSMIPAAQVEKNRRSKGEVYRNKRLKSHTFVSCFPVGLQPYIYDIKDVAADGNCGFTAIADLMGFGENEWLQVRKDLLKELISNVEHYKQLYGTFGRVNELVHGLSYFESHPKFDHWMTMPDMGHLIASAYNVVLFHLSSRQCLTFLPLRSMSMPTDPHKTIAIGFVNDNHFVEVFLSPDHPVPPITSNWYKYRDSCAKGWDMVYISRIQHFRRIIGNDVATDEIIIDSSSND